MIDSHKLWRGKAIQLHSATPEQQHNLLESIKDGQRYASGSPTHGPRSLGDCYAVYKPGKVTCDVDHFLKLYSVNFRSQSSCKGGKRARKLWSSSNWMRDQRIDHIHMQSSPGSSVIHARSPSVWARRSWL